MRRWWLFLFLAAASHGMLGAFTNGGAALGIRGFFTARGVEVLKSEVIWIWLPTPALALALFAARRRN